MRAVWVGLVAAALTSSLACAATRPQPLEPVVLTQDQTHRADDYGDENSVGLPEERVSRWRWAGQRKQCAYLVGNQCFRDENAACDAARCPEACVFDRDAAPVRVSCGE
jgi:hypothetical protein